jgi:hypothetical protein
MSQPRFAAITASLLARKGEAQPWAEPAKKPLSWDTQVALPPPEQPRMMPPPPLEPPRRTAPEPRMVPPLAREKDFASASALASRDLKKISVRMSHHDYERLGILAIKQGKTRQRLLQETVDGLIGGIMLTFGSGCACLSAEQSAPFQTMG